MSRNLTNTYTVGAYIRLSKEDLNNSKESESVINQREYIIEYSNKNDLNIHDFYIDDGYTGSNFDRPAFKRLIKDIQDGIINTVITKDTSRLGRDFIETGHYMFKYFPENDIRYIAILENFDTYKPNGVEDIIPFQTVINDMYLKDTSRKIKSIRQNKMKNGLYVGSTIPYGYKRSNEDVHKFVIDEYSANIVRRIFNMRISGNTPTIIARTLTDEGILPPSVYNSKKIKKTFTTNIWKVSSINHMLDNEVYIGNLIQRKFDKVSYKSKKKIKLAEDNWIRVENTHNAIISKEIFKQAQLMKETKSGTRNKKLDYLLKGLVVCADCGKKMAIRKGYKKYKKASTKDYAYYCCRTNITYRNGTCSLHYYKEEDLNILVIKELKDILSIYKNRNALRERYESKKDIINSIESFENELSTYKNKIVTIEKAIRDLYLDRANNILSNEDFYKIKSGLENDKSKYNSKVKDIETMIISKKSETNNDNKIEEIIANFLKLNKPTKQILTQLIKKIEINEDKKIKIFYNFNIKESINLSDGEVK